MLWPSNEAAAVADVLQKTHQNKTCTCRAWEAWKNNCFCSLNMQICDGLVAYSNNYGDGKEEVDVKFKFTLFFVT